MKLTKKSISIALVAMFVSFLTLYMLSLAPTAQEALAVEIYHIETQKNQVHLQAEELRAELEALGEQYRELDERSKTLNAELYPFETVQ